VSIISGHHSRKGTQPVSEITPVLSAEQLKTYRGIIQSIFVEPNLLRYIGQIIHESRNNPALFLGASPRASVAILTSAKAYAALNGRDFVTPEDIKVVALPVLRHRIILTPDKEMEGITPDEIVKQIVDKIEVPR
jgi:MoxR-like ATPase